MDIYKLHFNRIIRNQREYFNYIFRLKNGKNSCDNHIYKRKRILNIQKSKEYDAFIETGTFYGQMIYAVKDSFKKIYSIELFDKLFILNLNAFKKYKHIKIILGDSSSKLSETIDLAGDNIVFWLDGHYSGSGTAQGELTSPILQEIEIIKSKNLTKFCILIDDIRLFNGQNGYPTLNATIELIDSLNCNCKIVIDSDCLIAESY